MGYMGFGMRKEVYTRKPKTSFARIKEIYGDHLERFTEIKNKQGEWSDNDKEDFRVYVRKRIKKEQLQESTYNAIVFLILLIIVGFAIYMAGAVL